MSVSGLQGMSGRFAASMLSESIRYALWCRTHREKRAARAPFLRVAIRLASEERLREVTRREHADCRGHGLTRRTAEA